MQQLKMLRYQQKITPHPLPDGYRCAFFAGTDAEINDWVTICRYGLLPENGGKECFDSCIMQYPDLIPEKNLFFVIDPSGRRVATSAAVSHPSGEGYLHMVAALPECRGKGIGHAMLSFALEIMESSGCTHAVLTTDDFRLPAIKTYLDGGFRPVLYHDPESDMKERWDAVIAALKYEPVDYIREV